MTIIERQINQLLMEIFVNTKYQGLAQLISIELPPYFRKPLGQSHFGNQSVEKLSIQTKKIGFVPFKIPEEKISPSSQSMTEQASSGCVDLDALSDDDLDSSIHKSSKNKKGPYRKYTLEEKLKAVEILNSGVDLRSVAKRFNIPRRNLLRWRKNGCQRKQGGGRPTDSRMESAICSMIKEGKVTTEDQIRESAKKLSGLKNFKASKGWFVKFCRRYGIDTHPLRSEDKENI